MNFLMEEPNNHLATVDLTGSVKDCPILQYQAIEDDDRQSSLAECYDEDGELNAQKFALFAEKEEDLDVAQAKIDASIYSVDNKSDEDTATKRAKEEEIPQMEES